MQRELLSLGIRDLHDLTLSQLGSVVLAPPTNSALFRVLVGVDQAVSPVKSQQRPPPIPQKPDKPSFGAPMDALPLEEFERLRQANYAKGESPGRRIGHKKRTEVKA